MDKKILIGFPEMAGFLGVSIRRVFQHRQAMRAVGAIEDHIYKGRLYTVSAPNELNRYWRGETF